MGETGATIKSRLKQHQKAVFENKKNDSAQRQETAPGQGLNKDIGRYVKTNTWLPLLKKDNIVSLTSYIFESNTLSVE